MTGPNHGLPRSAPSGPASPPTAATPSVLVAPDGMADHPDANRAAKLFTVAGRRAS